MRPLAPSSASSTGPSTAPATGPPARLDFSQPDRLTPEARRLIGLLETGAMAAGGTAILLRHGLRTVPATLAFEIGCVTVVALVILAVTLWLRDRASLARATFRRQRRPRLVVLSIWATFTLAVLVFGPARLGLGWVGFDTSVGRAETIFLWSDMVMILRIAAGLVGVTRGVTAGQTNPALLLAGSFVVLIAVGTIVLLLPRCRSEMAPHHGALDRVRVAAFTATSACCVTGLIVVPTGGPEAYWSRTGQAVILCLFQIGGLGIMTCGAFFALAGSRSMRVRETATLREIFDPDQPVDVRRLVLAILAFTFGSELVGAVLLCGLWSDLPAGEQAWMSVFHAVSAFCNAGFDLTGQSFLGRAAQWQVWGVLAGLIIVGGLGFGVLYNVAHALVSRGRRWQRQRTGGAAERGFIERTLRPTLALRGGDAAPARPVRVTVMSRLVITATVLLLSVGTLWLFVFEATPGGTGTAAPPGTAVPAGQRLADAWFQSVTFRTAGFNTVDLEQLRPASKLLAMILMYIGASPVSTGGGVKTVAVAVAVLALAAILRGRPHAEIAGRRIPDDVAKRALTVLALGASTVVATALLLAAFENDSEIPLIDLLFEAASACGTVGVSANVTPRLSTPSQLVLMVAMFLGRIGPLTILLGLAGLRQTAKYEYPKERVTLG